MKYIVALILSALISQLTFANDNSIVVYASYTGEGAQTLPCDTTIVTNLSTYATIGSALSSVANIITRNTTPHSEEVSMRGYGENGYGRVKILLDGVTWNSLFMTPVPLSLISPHTTGKIEILRGPNPILYGDGASAGVIRIYTNEEDGNTAKVSAGAYGYFSASYATQFTEDNTSYGASYAYTREDGYRAPFNANTISAKIKTKQQNNTITFKTDYAKTHYDMPGAISPQEAKYNPRLRPNKNDYANEQIYSASISDKITITEDKTFELPLTFRHLHRHTHWETSQSTYKSPAVTLLPRYRNESLLNTDTILTIGADLKYEKAQVAPNGYDYTRKNYAIFAETEYFLTDNLSIVTGLRTENFSDSFNHRYPIDAEFALNYIPDDQTKAFLKFTRFHRSPFSDELYYSQTPLLPEIGKSIDAGYRISPSQTTTISFGTYLTELAHEIFYDPEYNTIFFGKNTNSPSKTLRYGADIFLTQSLTKSLSLTFLYSYQHGEFRSSRYKEIPLCPNHLLNLSLTYTPTPALRFILSPSYRSSEYPASDFLNEFPKSPTALLLNSSIIYLPTPSLTLTLSATNLTNRHLYDFYGSTPTSTYCYPTTARAFYLSISYTF